MFLAFFKNEKFFISAFMTMPKKILCLHFEFFFWFFLVGIKSIVES